MRRPLLLLALVFAISACSPQSEARVPQANSSSSVSTAKKAASSSSMKSPGLKRFAPAKKPAAFQPVIPKDLRIPVLVYHHVRPTKGYAKTTWSWKMSVSPAIFDKQMQWLTDHGYTTVDLTTLAGILQGTAPSPAKPVVITFDDNQLSQYELAMPTLQKHGQIAVFYMIAGRLDSKGLLTREMIKDMAAKGMDIESHTMTHPVLTAVDAPRLEWELKESRRILEELIGKPVLHVAYPGTAHNQKVRDAAKAAGYVTASVMDPRRATEKDDLFKLPRIMMTDDTDLAKTLP